MLSINLIVLIILVIIVSIEAIVLKILKQKDWFGEMYFMWAFKRNKAIEKGMRSIIRYFDNQHQHKVKE